MVKRIYRDPTYYQSHFGRTDVLIRDAERRVRMINKLVDRRGRLLDIGCGAGHFLKVAKDSGWEVVGVEPAPPAVDHARKNVPDSVIHCGFLHECGDLVRGEPFDVVCSFAVIEHVIDPVGFLRRAIGLLKPLGLLCLSTPNMGGLVAKAIGKRFFFLTPPEHVSYFTIGAMERLLASQGMVPVVLRTHSGLGWSEIRQGLIRFLPPVVGRIVKSFPEGALKAPMRAGSVVFSLLDLLRLGTRMEVYARSSAPAARKAV
ncbi:MAG: class I SAM-dependent methyltransferase [Candidatus Methylomirabilales bacterium]